jgi:hypothetical protein
MKDNWKNISLLFLFLLVGGRSSQFHFWQVFQLLSSCFFIEIAIETSSAVHVLARLSMGFQRNCTHISSFNVFSLQVVSQLKRIKKEKKRKEKK